MAINLTLTGDINLMGVSDATAPFAKIGARLRASDLVFANLECCFYKPIDERSANAEGFYADPSTVTALADAGVAIVGNANNVNYGAGAIRASLDCLDGAGIEHVGAGRNAAQARDAVVLERSGVRVGFYQRTSVYWSQGHEADQHTPGVAIVAGHTAYRPCVENLRALTRPGCAPEVLTWADAASLAILSEEVRALRERCDILVASHHWGLDAEVLQYQREIAHTAIDAGADIVFGHGPHDVLPIEYYRGKPVFYGAGSFSFETGHRAKRHPDWLGLMVEAQVNAGGINDLNFQFVRHNAANETIERSAEDEPEALARLTTASRQLGVSLTRNEARIKVSAA